MLGGHFYWKMRWVVLNRFPFILFFIRFIPALRHTAVTRDTDLLIEGFPRSGNTFARNAFLFACDNKLSVSSHLHLKSTVKKAIRLNKPILILVRNPMDAVSSYLVYQGEYFPAEQALKEYIDFNSYVRENLEHIVVATFDKVTGDFGSVIDQVNHRFETRFPLFEHTPENVKHCLELTRGQVSPWLVGRRKWSEERNVSMPAEGRDHFKQQARARLLDVKNCELLARAEKIYEMLTSTPGPESDE